MTIEDTAPAGRVRASGVLAKGPMPYASSRTSICDFDGVFARRHEPQPENWRTRRLSEKDRTLGACFDVHMGIMGISSRRGKAADSKVRSANQVVPYTSKWVGAPRNSAGYRNS